MRLASARLYRAAVRLVGSTDEGYDVLQDALIRAYGAWSAGDAPPDEALGAWLYRIVTRTALNALRSRKRRRLRESGFADPELTTRPQAEARLALEALDALVADLPAEQRVAFVLREIEELSVPEIAAHLGCSEGAVEQRLVRARARLRERWNR